MKLLLYYPSNKKTVAMETMAKSYVERGHQLILLTTCEEGAFHQNLSAAGILTYTFVLEKKRNLFSYYFQHIRFLIKFCKQHDIEVVLSHLQPVNILAAVAGLFMKTKVLIFRHHDYAKNRKETITDYLINKFSKLILVPSNGVRNLMLKNESVRPGKLKVVPYVYDFSEYKTPDPEAVAGLKKQYSCDLLFIMVSRLVPEKRHLMVLKALNFLIKSGYNFKLLIMDDGIEKENIRNFIHAEQLQDNVFLLGYQPNIIDFIEASDVLLHPSLSEASCSAVKEAGLREKAVIVTKGVGDFDDYVVDEQNGFLITPDNDESLLIETIKKYYHQRDHFSYIGRNLRLDILTRFSNQSDVFNLYLDILK